MNLNFKLVRTIERSRVWRDPTVCLAFRISIVRWFIFNCVDPDVSNDSTRIASYRNPSFPSFFPCLQNLSIEQHKNHWNRRSAFPIVFSHTNNKRLEKEGKRRERDKQELNNPLPREHQMDNGRAIYLMINCIILLFCLVVVGRPAVLITLWEPPKYPCPSSLTVRVSVVIDVCQAFNYFRWQKEITKPSPKKKNDQCGGTIHYADRHLRFGNTHWSRYPPVRF